MRMSEEGKNALLKPFEGCKLKAYRCPTGHCTIGYGHTNEAGPPLINYNTVITQQQAEDILNRDLIKFEGYVNEMVKQPLTQHQFDVLVDFVYNEGPGNLRTSTMLKKINAGRMSEVPAELMKFTFGNGKVIPGLVRRRHAEAGWWISGESIATSAPEAAPTDDEHEQRQTADPVDAPSMAASKQGNAALVTAGLGGLGAVNEAISQVQTATDTATNALNLLHNPSFLIMSAVICLALAIWWFRKQHMEEHNV